MTDRKIITRTQYDYILAGVIAKWGDLADAPKHTDEYWEILLQDTIRNIRITYEARIKELEAKVPPEDWSGPMCYNDYELCHDIQSCWNDCPYKPKEAKQ